MAAVTTSNPADFANRLQTYFNPKLLQELQFALVLATYGMRQKYPANGTSIRFFRPRKANTTGTGTIAEGTTPTTLTEVAVGYVDVALAQRGALATITDLAQAVDLLNTVSLYTKTMGADAALDLDTVVRNALITGLNDSDTTFGALNFFERFAGVANTGTSSTDFASLKALTQAAGKMTRAAHLGAVTQLRKSQVPGIGGKYVCVIAPQVMHDVRQITDWVSAATQVDTQNLYKRGQIVLDGCVFVEADNPFIEDETYKTENTDGDDDATGTGLIYSNLYLGEGAFGCPELSDGRAGGSPMSPKLIINASPDKADPLNLKTTIGWKAFYGCKPLITTTNGTTPVTGEVPRYLNLRTKSTFQ